MVQIQFHGVIISSLWPDARYALLQMSTRNTSFSCSETQACKSRATMDHVCSSSARYTHCKQSTLFLLQSCANTGNNNCVFKYIIKYIHKSTKYVAHGSKVQIKDSNVKYDIDYRYRLYIYVNNYIYVGYLLAILANFLLFLAISRLPSSNFNCLVLELAIWC